MRIYSRYRGVSRKCNEWRKVEEVREKAYNCNKDGEWEINKRDWMKEVGVIILKGLWSEDEVNEKKYWSKEYNNRWKKDWSENDVWSEGVNIRGYK